MSGERAGGVRRPGSARSKLIAAAASRFYAEGVTATGIDTITADAGVAKMSLYNNFASKAELVQAYLEHRHQEFLDLHERRAAALPAGAGAGARVLVVFDAYLDHAQLHGEGFRGCGLLNVAAELPVGHPGRATVARHKAEIQQLLVDALQDADHPDADRERLAEHLSFLLEGAMVRAGLDGDDHLLRRACEAAAGLVEGW
jgi:AcrR family transcriptional regulator